MISTRDLSRLPDLASLRKLTQALAMLDAILSPDWQSRYYSFNSRWAAGQMMTSMRDGEGDEWHAIFCEAGARSKGSRSTRRFAATAPSPVSSTGFRRSFMRIFEMNPRSGRSSRRSASGA